MNKPFQTTSEIALVSVKGQSFRVVLSHNPAFWSKVNDGNWEPATYVVLKRLLTDGTPYVDCGAWIGPTALYAASLGAAVTAIECDPIAIQYFKENLFLNPGLSERVTLIESGLTDRDGPFVLHSSRFGNSQSSVFEVVERHSTPLVLRQQVIVQGLDTLRVFTEAGWLNDPYALIKIDTEGAEYAMLNSLGTAIAEATCSFYISFHPMNLVSTDEQPDELIRRQATRAWMDQFWDYTWWSGASGAIRKINKEEFLELAMDGKRLPPILFSRRTDFNDR